MTYLSAQLSVCAHRWICFKGDKSLWILWFLRLYSDSARRKLDFAISRDFKMCSNLQVVEEVELWFERHLDLLEFLSLDDSECRQILLFNLIS